MDSNTVTFLHRVNDRVRKMLDQSSKDAIQDSNKHSFIWGSFMSSTLQASVFIGKNYSENLRSIENTGNNLTMKQMFNISEKLITEQSDEIYGVNTINWVIPHWNIYLWLVAKKSSLYHRARRLTYFQILCYALERWSRTHYQILSGRTNWRGSKVHHNTELWAQLMVSQWNSSGIFSQESPHCSSATKSKSSCLKWANQNNSKDELSSCRCSMTSYGELKTVKRNVLLVPHLCLYVHKDFHQEDGHSSDLDQKRSGILLMVAVAELMMIKFGESGHPVFRATSPLSQGTLKSRGGGKLSIHFCADGGTIETVFRTIISVNQLSIYGAVSDLCEEYKACQIRTGETCTGRTIWPIVRAYCKSTKNEWTSCHNKIVWSSFVLMQDSWERLTSDSTSWQKHWRIFTIYRISGLSWVHLAKRRSIISPERLDSREHQNWARVTSQNQLPVR